MNSNIDIKQKPIKLTIPEYSAKHDISTSTVRNWIRAEKVEFELVKGKYLIYDYQVDINSTQSDINIDINKSNDLLLEKDNLIQSLQDQVEYLKKDIEGKDGQINEFLTQQNQYQQIIMSMNQNQKLLVESKRTWLQRLFGLNVEST